MNLASQLKSHLTSLPNTAARSSYLKNILSQIDTTHDHDHDHDHDPTADELSIRTLYELQPYPPRQHKQHQYGHKLLVECMPDVIQQYVRGGHEFNATTKHPYRILIAGGGTGDPTLSCANSFFRAGIPVQVVHLDLSMSSNQIAMARVKHLLDPMLAQQIFFIRGSISDISKMIKIRSSGGGDGDVLDRGKLSQHHKVDDQHRHRQPFDTGNSQHVGLISALFAQGFDYIHSTGVLHHTSDPSQSLNALITNSLLRKNGGLALWVYASSGGRAGVHDFQQIMNILMPRRNSEAEDERIAWGEHVKEAEVAEDAQNAQNTQNTQNALDEDKRRRRVSIERLKKNHKKRMKLAWKLLERLPETNRLARNPVLRQSVSGWLKQHNTQDQGEKTEKREKRGRGEEQEELPAAKRWEVRLSDMLLNPFDREFTARQARDWLWEAGVRPAKWLDVDSGNFDLTEMKNIPEIQNKLRKLSDVEILELGERWRGTAVGHRVIAVRNSHSFSSGTTLSAPANQSPRKIAKGEKKLRKEYSYVRV